MREKKKRKKFFKETEKAPTKYTITRGKEKEKKERKARRWVHIPYTYTFYIEIFSKKKSDMWIRNIFKSERN